MNFLKKIILPLLLIAFSLLSLSAQSPTLQDSLNLLTEKGIQLDDKDLAWLATPKNRAKIFNVVGTEIKEDDLAPIQIMIKLSSNELLFDLSEEEIEANDALLTKIIHGAFDQFGKEEHKMLSATSWYRIFKKQMEADSKE